MDTKSQKNSQVLCLTVKLAELAYASFASTKLLHCQLHCNLFVQLD